MRQIKTVHSSVPKFNQTLVRKHSVKAVKDSKITFVFRQITLMRYSIIRAVRETRCHGRAKKLSPKAMNTMLPKQSREEAMPKKLAKVHLSCQFLPKILVRNLKNI